MRRPCFPVGAPIGSAGASWVTMRRLANKRRGWEYLLELVLLRFLVLEGPGGLLVERLGCELGIR